MTNPTSSSSRSLTLADLKPRRPERRRWVDYFRPPPHPMLVFDPEKCTGCGICETVCSRRNTGLLAPEQASIRVLRDEARGKHLAVHCQHCRRPLCLEVCPTRAIERGEDGIVRIDPVFCVSCGLCTQACPEAAPLRNGADEKIHKCDGCEGDPRCVSLCPQGALAWSRGKRFRWIKGARWTVQALSFLALVLVFVGTFCYFYGGDVSVSCPAGTLQNMAATGRLLWSGIGAAAFLLALTLLLGRVFCGWVCPFGFVLDLVDKITPKKLGWPAFFRNRMIKYGVLAGAVGGSAAVGFQAFCTICPIGTLCRSYGAQGFFRGAELAVVPLLAGLEAAERRAWCRYFCPVGATLALVAKIGLIKIVIGAKRCKKFSCIQCAEVCPTGIIAAEQLREGLSPAIPMTECLLCLRCVDRCPYGAAKIRLRWQRTAPEERALPTCATVKPAPGGAP